MRQSIILLAAMTIALVLGSGIAIAAVKFGTEGRDVLIGTNAKDVLFGKGSNDRLAGRGADDVLYGGEGRDCMFGGSEDDILYGGSGNDHIGLYCFAEIFDAGEDIMYGDSGNDEIIAIEHPWNARKQQRDTVFCGSGKDTVYYVKGVDRTFNCEQKFDVVEEGGF